MKRTMMASAVAALALGGGIATAAPANAQQNGLVNIDRVLNNNNVAVTVPINVAANVCGVTVAVLAADLLEGPVNCDARGGQDVTVSLPQ